LKPDVSGVDNTGTGTWNVWIHNPILAPNGTWGTQHRVDAVVKLVRWGSDAQSICSWAGGPKIFLARQADVYETSTYTVELDICDGSIHIQKKEWGVNNCGKDPRAVDCGAGGTWYLLAQAHPGVPSFGVWHTFSAVDKNNANGSLTLTGYLDGVQEITYTECISGQTCSDPHGPLPNPPLYGGREGWRSNAIDYRMDSYTVTASN